MNYHEINALSTFRLELNKRFKTSPRTQYKVATVLLGYKLARKFVNGKTITLFLNTPK